MIVLIINYQIHVVLMAMSLHANRDVGWTHLDAQQLKAKGRNTLIKWLVKGLLNILKRPFLQILLEG